MSRQLAIAKKVSLSGVAHGWGDECYVMLMPATYDDMIAVDELDQSDKRAQAEFQKQFVKSHFVSGKIRIVGADEPVDMEPNDCLASVELTDKLFLACIGDDLDPKEARAAVIKAAQQANAAELTETSSSTV